MTHACHAAIRAASVLGLTLLVGCAAGSPKPQHNASEPCFLSDLRESRLTMRMLPHTGYPTVAAWLDDAPARFIIDTGGRDTMITAGELIDRARQAARTQPSLRLSGTRYPAQSLRKLRVGDALTFDSVRTIVTDLNNLRALEGEPVDGWLTMAALEGVTLDLDLLRGNGVICRSDKRVPLSDTTSTSSSGATPLRRPAGLADDPRPFAVLRLGALEVPALIDTGSYDAITLPRAMLESTGATLRDARPSLGTGGFGSTLQPSTRGVIDRVTLDGIELTHVAVHVVPHETMRYAVVGMPVLRHYRLIYDAPGRRLTLIGPARIDGAAPSSVVVNFVENLGK